MCQPEFPYWVKALANLDNKPSLEKTLRSNCYCWMKSRWCKGTPGNNMNWLVQLEETNKWRYFQLIRHFRFTCTGCSSSGVHHWSIQFDMTSRTLCNISSISSSVQHTYSTNAALPAPTNQSYSSHAGKVRGSRRQAALRRFFCDGKGSASPVLHLHKS